MSNAPTYTADELAIVADLNAGRDVTLPEGGFNLPATAVLWKPSQRLVGAGSGRTYLYRPSGIDPAVRLASNSNRNVLAGVTIRSTTPRPEFKPGAAEHYSHLRRYFAGESRPVRDYAVGVADTGERAGGSQNQLSRFEDVWVEGWDVGVQIGYETGVCASELSFERCEFHGCRVPAQIEGGGNSLNIWFDRCGFMRCDGGVQSWSGGNVHLDRCWSSLTGHRIDAVSFAPSLLMIGWAGTFSVTRCRAENVPSGCLVRCGQPGRGVLAVSGNELTNAGQTVEDSALVWCCAENVVEVKGNLNTAGGLVNVWRIDDKSPTGKQWQAARIERAGNVKRAGFPDVRHWNTGANAVVTGVGSGDVTEQLVAP